MHRVRFSKTGNSIWISHLDLMRLLMRAFRRAGLMLKHSQGYSPHPELSILLPLSVGVSSGCELADFELAEGCEASAGEIPELLNPVLPEGIRVLDCYDGGLKAGKLAWLLARLTLIYDGGVPEGAAEAIGELFRRPSLTVEKHGKKGPVELDIQPLHKDVAVRRSDDRTLILETVAAAQNPTLNPLLLASAVETYLPAYKPDHTRCHRVEFYDAEMRPFR